MMTEANNSCAPEKPQCAARREFLTRTSLVAGGLLLTVTAAPTNAQDKTKPAEQDKPKPVEEVTLKLDEKSPLSKVGGSVKVEAKSGNIIVARTGETTFAAFVAKCTHSGGPISYDATAKQFSCPWHGSVFGPDGKNVSGPAKRPLTPVATQNALVLTLPK